MAVNKNNGIMSLTEFAENISSLFRLAAKNQGTREIFENTHKMGSLYLKSIGLDLMRAKLTRQLPELSDKISPKILDAKKE